MPQVQDQLKVLSMLDDNMDRFAFSLKDIEPFTRAPLQINLVVPSNFVL